MFPCMISAPDSRTRQACSATFACSGRAKRRSAAGCGGGLRKILVDLVGRRLRWPGKRPPLLALFSTRREFAGATWGAEPRRTLGAQPFPPGAAVPPSLARFSPRCRRSLPRALAWLGLPPFLRPCRERDARALAHPLRCGVAGLLRDCATFAVRMKALPKYYKPRRDHVAHKIATQGFKTCLPPKVIKAAVSLRGVIQGGNFYREVVLFVGPLTIPSRHEV